MELDELPTGGTNPHEALTATEHVIFPLNGKADSVPTRFFDRRLLKAGNIITGPAIIEQFDSTVVVTPGLSAEVDKYGTLTITDT